jgi:hypothetical protein
METMREIETKTISVAETVTEKATGTVTVTETGRSTCFPIFLSEGSTHNRLTCTRSDPTPVEQISWCHVVRVPSRPF